MIGACLLESLRNCAPISLCLLNAMELIMSSSFITSYSCSLFGFGMFLFKYKFSTLVRFSIWKSVSHLLLLSQCLLNFLITSLVLALDSRINWFLSCCRSNSSLHLGLRIEFMLKCFSFFACTKFFFVLFLNSNRSVQLPPGVSGKFPMFSRMGIFGVYLY